jgi:predicted transcriptional regulator of viral defense system
VGLPMPNKSRDLGGLSAHERELISLAVAEERTSISADDVQRTRGCSRSMAHQILSRLERKGWLHRLRRGIYSVVPLGATEREPAIENGWLVAMAVFQPAFISGWTAAEHWNLTEQIFNTIAVVTTTKPRHTTQTIGGVRFRVRAIEEHRFFGAEAVWFGSASVQVADASRTLIDIADLPKLGGGGRHMLDVVRAYWRSEHRDPQRLLDYAKRYGRGAVFKRLGFLAETFQAPVDKQWLEACRSFVPQGITNLDPDAPPKGRIVSRWNLRVNLPLGES